MSGGERGRGGAGEAGGGRAAAARPIGLHELRHVWVSLLHDAGFTLEQIASFAGHASAWMTERYKHLLPGAAASAGERFGNYLERAATLHRLGQLERLARTPTRTPRKRHR